MLKTITEDNLTLRLHDTDILKNITLCAKICGKDYTGTIKDVTKTENTDIITYSFCEENYHIKLILKHTENGLCIDVDAALEMVYLMQELPTFDADRAITISFNTDLSEGFAARYMETRWWSYIDFEAIPPRTQSLMIKNGDFNVCLAPQCTDYFKGQFVKTSDKIELYIGAECSGFSEINGTVLCLTYDTDPYDAARKMQLLQTTLSDFTAPLKKEKEYPPFLEGLGWCTWNAFYHDVTADKIEMKLKEFRDKGIKLSWLLIDDGWTETENWRMQTLTADKKKFPNGLKGFIDYIKKEYGVKYVGIWHSFMAYWWGIDPKSKIAEEFKDCLMMTKSGILMPDFTDRDKMYKFFDSWHKYLHDEGIDGLKVDTQGEVGLFLRDNCSVVNGAKNAHYALEESVKKYFGYNLINCMGMGMEETCARSYSSLIRSSDDFYPNKEGSFKKHITQNVYNSIFLDDLYFCDFDMWWTNQKASVQSGALRAISGGPIYISDEVGATNADMLIPMFDENGYAPRPDSAAMPVKSQAYGFTDVIKIMNTYGNVDLIGAFNTAQSTKECSVTMSDLKDGSCDEYVAYLYFAKKFVRFNKDTVLTFNLAADACEIINFYPVSDGKIMLGDTSKYISCGFKLKETDINEIL